jgi:hypothetical protein
VKTVFTEKLLTLQDSTSTASAREKWTLIPLWKQVSYATDNAFVTAAATDMRRKHSLHKLHGTESFLRS